MSKKVNEPPHEILLLIFLAINNGSDKPVPMCKLARAYSGRYHYYFLIADMGVH